METKIKAGGQILIPFSKKIGIRKKPTKDILSFAVGAHLCAPIPHIAAGILSSRVRRTLTEQQPI